MKKFPSNVLKERKSTRRAKAMSCLESCLFNSHFVILTQTTGNPYPRPPGNNSTGEETTRNPGLPSLRAGSPLSHTRERRRAIDPAKRSLVKRRREQLRRSISRSQLRRALLRFNVSLFIGYGLPDVKHCFSLSV